MGQFEICMTEIVGPEARPGTGSEGSFVNDPRDRGGATNMGITIATLSDFDGKPASVADVKALTRAKAVTIYKAKFWNALACDKLPAGVDFVVLDHGIMSGPSRSAKMLQRAVGVTPDGAIGEKTLAAVADRSPLLLLADLRAARLDYYRGLSDYDRFGKGWEARTARTHATALAMVRRRPVAVAPDPVAPPATSALSGVAATLRDLSGLISGLVGILQALAPRLKLFKGRAK